MKYSWEKYSQPRTQVMGIMIPLLSSQQKTDPTDPWTVNAWAGTRSPVEARAMIVVDQMSFRAHG